LSDFDRHFVPRAASNVHHRVKNVVFHRVVELGRVRKEFVEQTLQFGPCPRAFYLKADAFYVKHRPALALQLFDFLCQRGGRPFDLSLRYRAKPAVDCVAFEINLAVCFPPPALAWKQFNFSGVIKKFLSHHGTSESGLIISTPTRPFLPL